MIITNKYGIPRGIAEILATDFYDHEGAAGTLSATTLLKPVQISVLEKRYGEKIEVDVIDRIWSLYGQGLHAVLEQYAKDKVASGDESYKDSLVEERLFAKVLGETVSGKFDLILNGTKLHDNKMVKAWAVAFGGRIEEWAKQLSIYRWLLWMNKKTEVDDDGTIRMFIRDWDENDAAKYKHRNYPQSPVGEIDIELMSVEAAGKMVAKLVKQFKEASALKDGELPECSAEDRWFNDKKGNIRCDKYCLAKQFCQQYKQLNKERK